VSGVGFRAEKTNDSTNSNRKAKSILKEGFLLGKRTKAYLILISLLIILGSIALVHITSGQRTFLTGNSSTEANKNTAQGAAYKPQEISHNTTGYLLSLASDKSSYTLGDRILLDGNVINNTKNGFVPVNNARIIIEGFQNNDTIYKNLTITDKEGKFRTAFVPPADGTTKISARLYNSASIQQIISVIVTKQVLFVIIILLGIIGGTFAVLLFLSPRLQKESIFIAIILIVIGYVLIYRYPPLDGLANSALATGLIAPLAVYAVDALNKRREANAQLESTVWTYRDENLKKEVQSLLKIHEEINQHQSVFQARFDDLANRLSKTLFNDTTVGVLGTMANLPALRIDKYYYYVDHYNNFLQDKVFLERTSHPVYNDFNKHFQDLKRIYSELNQILYINLIYDEGEILSRFLSFPTVEFPSRLSGPVLDRLYNAGVLDAKRMFRWNQVESKDRKDLLNLLTKRFNLNWVKDASIRKDSSTDTVEISDDNNKLSISLDKKSNKAVMKVNDEYLHTFIVKEENGEIEICCIAMPNKRIYSKENAVRLMELIAIEFKKTYEELENTVANLLKIPKIEGRRRKN